MPNVLPFRAVRYSAGRLRGDLSAVLAPPYDVLDQADKHALLARSEDNIVAVDLPYIPPKSAGPPQVYLQAAERMQTWLSAGVLIRDETPSIYVYHQRFTHEGRTFTRRMFIANLRLVPFSEKSILPHEQTFGGPKEDRLALMKATQAQLSPIFGMYSDPQNAVDALLQPVTAAKPDATGTVDGVENSVWAVADARLIKQVSDLLADRPVYIADGHHRYGTALLYREHLAGAGRLPDDHPANYIMFVLCSMDDPGCLILPYHRVLGDIGLVALTAAWAAATAPAGGNAADIRLWDAVSGREVALRFTRRDVLRTLAPGQPDAWYELDYSYLHTYLLEQLLTRAMSHPPKIHYVKSTEQARETAREEHGVALLMNATKMAHLRGVSEAGGLMPQKSTYFHPKLATGVTINMLA